MGNATANTQLEAALKRCQPAVTVLRELNAMNVEQVTWKEDHGAILVYRWVVPHAEAPNRFLNVVLYATPDWYDLFVPIVQGSARAEPTLRALREWTTSEVPA